MNLFRMVVIVNDLMLDIFANLRSKDLLCLFWCCWICWML